MADIDRKTASGTGRWAVRAALFLGLAVVAAGLAALLLTRWVNARTAIARVPTVKVVVAAVDLPVGTRVSAEHLVAVEWPVASSPASAAAEPTALLGKIVAGRIFKGEPVLPEKLVSGSAGSGLAALLPDGARAVSVRVDDVVGVAGFIHPGDAVDVIVTMKPSEASGSQFTSKTILQNIKVLAVGKEVDAAARGGDKVLPATVATLQVDSVQAERLALAASKGQLLLALRNAGDGELVETRGVAPTALLLTPEPAAPQPAPKTEPAPAPERPRIARVKSPAALPARVEKPVPERQVVEILRGDLFERRGFEKKEGP